MPPVPKPTPQRPGAAKPSPAAGGMFGSLSQVPAAGGVRLYFKDGSYLAELRRMVHGVSEKRGVGEYVAAEFLIRDVLVEYEGSNKAGELVSVTFMSKHGDAAIANLRALLAAACGMDANDDALDWEGAANAACDGSGEALAGTLLEVVTATVPTRAGGVFTKTAFSAPAEG